MLLSPDLLNQLRNELVSSNYFDSDHELKALFVDPRIEPWRYNVPQGFSTRARVNSLIEYLTKEANNKGESALLLFLRVLVENTPSDTGRKQKLLTLIQELENTELHEDSQKTSIASGATEKEEQNEGTITVDSPLLVGIVFDLSYSMMKTIRSIPKKSKFTEKKLSEAFGIIVEKAALYCKTPEADELLPLMSTFVYGYGFGTIRHSFASVISGLGIQTKGFLPESIPNEPIRDAFVEIASKENIPLTPNILDLEANWEQYRKSVEAQLVDIGSGRSLLYTVLNAVYNRTLEELKQPYYKHPLIFIISNGEMDDATDEELNKIAHQIQQLGGQIIGCYLSAQMIVAPNRLHNSIDQRWPKSATRLFNISSILKVNQQTQSIIKMAHDKGWYIPENARLFIQINQEDMLKELVEVVLSPLKD